MLRVFVLSNIAVADRKLINSHYLCGDKRGTAVGGSSVLGPVRALLCSTNLALYRNHLVRGYLDCFVNGSPHRNEEPRETADRGNPETPVSPVSLRADEIESIPVRSLRSRCPILGPANERTSQLASVFVPSTSGASMRCSSLEKIGAEYRSRGAAWHPTNSLIPRKALAEGARKKSKTAIHPRPAIIENTVRVYF